MKQAIIGFLIVLGIIGGAVIFGKSEDVSGIPSNNTYGPDEGIVTLIEYGDFECAACAQFYPIIGQLKEIYKEQVKFEFRHFPLVQIHGNATAAHRAAEAAAKQGKFWEMHDLLYERQANWRSTQATGQNGISNNNPGKIFEEYAKELGLDFEQYKNDVVDSATLGTINADTALGKEDHVSGTPTFLLEGKVIEDTGSVASLELFSAVIDAAISEAEGNPDTVGDSETPAKSEDE